MRTLQNSTRRGFLAAVTAGMSAGYAFAGGDKPVGPPKIVKIVDFDAMGKRKDVMEVAKIVKTDAEWRKQLNAEQFDVTRKAGTEYAFSGKYWNLHDDGLYSCICC